MVDGAEAECRLCFESGGDLIAPCNCRGTSKWVHRECLNRWRSMNHNPRAFTHCSECQFEFHLEQVTRTQPEMQRRFQLRVARDSGLVFLAIQSVIFLTALFLRICDPNEVLVEIIGLRQLPGQDESHGLWNALEHHKTTYYIAGLLLCLFLLGVTAACVACYDYLGCSGGNRGQGTTLVDYYFRPDPYRGQRRHGLYRNLNRSHSGGGGVRRHRPEGDCCCCCRDATDACCQVCCRSEGACCCGICEDCGGAGGAVEGGGGGGGCSCPQCGAVEGEGAGMVMLVLFFICVFIGIIVAVVSLTVVIQRIIQRHYRLLQAHSKEPGG